LVVMTSGNLLNIKAYEKIGGFWEDLFIDRVDHEYCLRLKQNNYRVIQINSLILEHPLGRFSKHILLNRTYFTSNHPGYRRYYVVRNTLHVVKKYRKIFPEYVRMEKGIFFRDLRRIILFEADKINKLKMIVKGYIDFKKNVFGKLQEKKDKI